MSAAATLAEALNQAIDQLATRDAEVSALRTENEALKAERDENESAFKAWRRRCNTADNACDRLRALLAEWIVNTFPDCGSDTCTKCPQGDLRLRTREAIKETPNA